MQEPETEPESKRPDVDTRNKRSVAEKALDLKEIGELILRGKSVRDIADILSTRRPYALSFQQVASDRKKLLAMWQKDAVDSISAERAKMLKRLELIEDELWEAWERSKRDETRRTAGKVSLAEGGKDSSGSASDIRENSAVVKVTRDGDATFLGKILDVQDRRAKLLGLDSPTKIESSGPGGGPIPIAVADVPLTDDEQEAILARHFERMQRKQQHTATDGNGTAPSTTANPA